MNKVERYVSIGILFFTLLSCSAFPSARTEEPSGRDEVRVYWVLDGTMSRESAEMFLERYLLPTSLSSMLWTDFSLQGDEFRLETAGGYRVVRKEGILLGPLGDYAVHGYDLTVDVSLPARAPERRKSYEVRFTYPGSADSSGRSSGTVLPQPLQQALLAAIREDGRSSGKARVAEIEYLGSGRFRATVSVGG